MSIFLRTAGAALIMLGLGIGVIILTKPGVLDAMGIRIDIAALLLIGGILATGQSGIIAALKPEKRLAKAAEGHGTTSVVVLPSSGTAPVASPNAFVRKPEASGSGLGVATAAASVAAAGAGLAAMNAKASSKDPVSETISALEKAKADVIKSMGGMDAVTDASPTPKAESVLPLVHAEEPAAPDEESAEMEDGLFVVDEKVIRGRQARILSDDTVEAETDEGWMRFENLDHLNEYLDSVEEQSA